MARLLWKFNDINLLCLLIQSYCDPVRSTLRSSTKRFKTNLLGILFLPRFIHFLTYRSTAGVAGYRFNP